MEMSTNIVDLPSYIKEKFTEELSFLNFTLVDDKPMFSSTYGYMYKVKGKNTDDLAVFKVIVISSRIDGEERKSLMKSVNEEVNTE